MKYYHGKKCEKRRAAFFPGNMAAIEWKITLGTERRRREGQLFNVKTFFECTNFEIMYKLTIKVLHVIRSVH